MLICPLCGYLKAWIQKNQVVLLPLRQRLEFFAPACGDGPAALQAKRDVASKLGAKFRQLGETEPKIPKAVQPDESRGRVGAAPGQARAQWNLFPEADPRPREFARMLLKQARRLHDDVAGAAVEPWVPAFEHALHPGLKAEGI